MKNTNTKIKNIIKQLKKENIQTWFDVGLFLDRIKENRKIPQRRFIGSYDDFKSYMCKGGFAFLTYQYSIDGVSIEVEKYTKILNKKFNGSNIHYITGKFYTEAKKLVPNYVEKCELPIIQAFDDWDLYDDFFFTKLERGSEEYNDLIGKFWNQTINIVEELGGYITDNKIGLLYLINVCSNPGNVSLSMAVVLLSELLGIPVINNNHDFYWEGGNSEIEKKQKNLSDGPRDFFFRNSHVGEFFSIIEVLFPWESRIWINVNINKQQTEHLIKINGHNPANVLEIGTAVDTTEYQDTSKRKKINTFHQFEQVLSRYSDTLISYSAKDVIESDLVSPENPRPILIGAKNTKPLVKFLNENIIFLQPTRIISRKRIEIGFELIERLFLEEDFNKRFKETKHLKLTIIITGPVAGGHFEYLRRLIRKFKELIDSLEEGVRNKIFLAFLFSELDKPKFKKHFETPVGIPELYNISSLILLPSKTEGRGLPIIEAAACGTPIFCSRYYPENVYSEVIGEHLPHSDRLKVIEFDGKNITKKHVKKIIERVFYPHKFSDEIVHNKKVVDKRYSLDALKNNIDDICYRMYRQFKSNRKTMNIVKRAISDYKELCNYTNEDFKKILNTENREYLPGYGRMRFMILLKSLIDPSYFRVEEQLFRGMAFNYAKELINSRINNIPEKQKIKFFNAIEGIFLYKSGEVKIRHDHSLPYRHRNKDNYPYQDFTIQELSGLINFLYHSIINPNENPKINTSAHFFTDFDLALSQLTSSTYLGIDDRKFLIKKLQANLPIAYFPGKYIKNELEFFALQAVRSRLELRIEEELTEEVIEKNANYISPIYIMASKTTTIENYNSQSIKKFIINGQDEELILLYKYNILQVIEINQLCIGIHFNQLGDEGLSKLKKVKEENGFIISNRQESSVMTDIVDIDRFHIGKVEDKLTEAIMGIPLNSGFIQFVPAGIRPTLAYPTPVQTAKDFNKYLKSKEFKKVIEDFGEKEVYERLKTDAETKMSPIKKVIGDLLSNENISEAVSYEYVSGVYNDGMPWSGVVAKANMKNYKNWEFIAESSKKTKRVTDFVKSLKTNSGKTAKIAWNGGYILNAELVGKLGLPESYIGSPLGLLISEGRVLSAPLFNKPALIFKNGIVNISRVNCSKGIIVSRGTDTVELSEDQYNTNKDSNKSCFYDLMYENEEIIVEKSHVIRLAGNIIKDIIDVSDKQNIKIIPVGLTLVIPKEKFPKSWKINDELEIKINGLENIDYAVEAGPMLIDNGEIILDMKKEGWKTQNSIKTQAARLDYTDMRGPKIAAGIDNEGNLIVLTINGRIRESVGATHFDMAEILKKFNIQKAMGFDPGGSSTLVVNGQTLNISPYNSRYEENIYSLPPEPRAVSNVIMGYIKD
ncbi:MAG: phosphodiester glycosidase family protein [Bacteroidales bacterium]|nr:phosphodiester glycosidase family protein [Bacteroidales bacterium]